MSRNAIPIRGHQWSHRPNACTGGRYESERGEWSVAWEQARDRGGVREPALHDPIAARRRVRVRVHAQPTLLIPMLHLMMETIKRNQAQSSAIKPPSSFRCFTTILG